jgi:quinol monooxygenase YgiN
MAVWFSLELPMTEQQADAILRELGLTNRPAPGQLFHIEGTADGSIRVVDVWESEQAFQQFFQERLTPAFQRAGAQVPEGLQPQFLQARNLLM